MEFFKKAKGLRYKSSDDFMNMTSYDPCSNSANSWYMRRNRHSYLPGIEERLNSTWAQDGERHKVYSSVVKHPLFYVRILDKSRNDSNREVLRKGTDTMRTRSLNQLGHSKLRLVTGEVVLGLKSGCHSAGTERIRQRAVYEATEDRQRGRGT